MINKYLKTKKTAPLNDLLFLNQSGTWGKEGTDKDYPVLRSTNIHEGKLCLDDIAFRKVGDKEAQKYILQEGDIVVTKSSGSSHLIGKCCIFNIKSDRKFLFSNFTQRLRVNNSLLNPNYLFYYLISSLGKAFLQKINNTTSGLRNLNMKDYGSQQIPLFPLPTQQKIASILEKAESAKEKRKTANRLTDEFLKSIFLEMFGDPVRNPKNFAVNNFKNILIIERDNVDPIAIKVGTKYIGLEHIEKEIGKIISFEIVDAGQIKSNKFKFSSQNLLLGKLRPYLNKVALPYFDGICSTDILPILPRKDVSDKYFLAFLLRHKSFVDYATERSTGANLPRISPNAVYEFKTYLPPIELQQKFADIVQKVDKLKEKQKESGKELDNLFNSLMQKAFSGEIK